MRRPTPPPPRPASPGSTLRPTGLAALRGRVRPNQIVPFLTLALLIVVFSPSANFLTIENLDGIINAAPVLLIVGIGATFPILAGGVDLSVAGIITLSGAVAAVLVPDIGEVALLLAAVVGLAMGLLNGAIVAYGRLPSFLVTLGMLFIANGLAVIVLGGVPVSYVGSVGSALTNNALEIGALRIRTSRSSRSRA